MELSFVFAVAFSVQNSWGKEMIQATVSGMTCGSCVKHVTQALQKLPGVEKVSVDLKSGIASIEPKDKQAPTVEEIKKAVEAAGYEVTDTKTVQK